MARTSGPAYPALEGTFRHAQSGVSYRVFRSGRAAFLSYDRRGDRPLHGVQELKYHVGSNTRGRTFLFDIDGFLYQSPINYYAAKKLWDMSPGYAHLRSMELNHPVDSTCLFCHASRLQRPRKSTVNGFDGPPFLQDGVGCERCHGPGGDHVNGRGSMINPVKLPEDRRDSICMQCHLEGEARIAKVGRAVEDYTPGEALSDYLAIFVREDDAQQRRAAVSHVESLALSRCKRESGAAMSCMSCHDPHVQPAEPAKALYYRAKCLRCHAEIAAPHNPRDQDCTACHMPRLESADISHTVVTDHRIVRARRDDDLPRSRTVGKLVQFGNPRPDARDLGLAYGELALRGETDAAREALGLLETARRQHPDDVEVLIRLGYLRQTRGETAAAEQMYEQALTLDPDRAVAAANLGVFYAHRGMIARAVALWRRAFENNPQLSDIGVNLTQALCASGDTGGARNAVRRVLAHNPDLDSGRQLLATIEGGGCRQP